MRVEMLLEEIGADFYTGVPDSQLKPLCDYLMQEYGIDKQHHVIAANEGNATAIAAGYHLATGRVPVVYLQNSGEGNIINPVASLLHDKVYAIPAIFIVGWRGEPGVHDEPQHRYQGEVTLRLLQDMDIEAVVLDAGTTQSEVKQTMEGFRTRLAAGKSVAFVIRKGALSYPGEVSYGNSHALLREEAILHIVKAAGEDFLVATTGKASRELFEIREALGQDHAHDFLTVGSMGHSSSIALGVAVHQPDKRVWCVDGDGALLMHMGAMAVIGATAPNNLIHIVINNEAHETVGGMPTVASQVDIPAMARACGYTDAVSVDSAAALDAALAKARAANALCLISVSCAIGARKDLGRPTVAAVENKRQFMEALQQD